MVSKFQWKPFWLATQRDPQNDWTATQNGVKYDVFAQAPLKNFPFGNAFRDYLTSLTSDAHCGGPAKSFPSSYQVLCS